MMLENQLKLENLKLSGFPEGAKGNVDVKIFISMWLVALLNLEEGVAPQITLAYHIGPSRRAHNSLPRDFLIHCYDMRTKMEILEVSRKKGHLMYQDHKIMVLQDLSVETLETRRRLHPLISILAWEKIVYKGVPLTAEDFGSVAKMLEHLGVDVPPEFCDSEHSGNGSEWHKANASTATT